MGTLNLQKPIGSPETSPYGAPRNGRLHKGIDYGKRKGIPVHASETGKVVGSQNNKGGYGLVIVIYHNPFAPEGYSRHIYTLYAHLSSVNVHARENVKKGDPIGLTGDTGSAKGNPHLHFEVIEAGGKGLNWFSAAGRTGIEPGEGRRNPNDYFGKDIEVEGTLHDAVVRAIEKRLEYVADIDLDRKNSARIQVWLDGKNIGYIDQDNKNIKLKYSYDVEEELRKMGA